MAHRCDILFREGGAVEGKPMAPRFDGHPGYPYPDIHMLKFREGAIASRTMGVSSKNLDLPHTPIVYGQRQPSPPKTDDIGQPPQGYPRMGGWAGGEGRPGFQYLDLPHAPIVYMRSTTHAPVPTTPMVPWRAVGTGAWDGQVPITGLPHAPIYFAGRELGLCPRLYRTGNQKDGDDPIIQGRTCSGLPGRRMAWRHACRVMTLLFPLARQYFVISRRQSGQSIKCREYFFLRRFIGKACS